MVVHVNRTKEDITADKARSVQNQKNTDMKVRVGYPTISSMDNGDSGLFFAGGKLKFVCMWNNQLHSIDFERL